MGYINACTGIKSCCFLKLSMRTWTGLFIGIMLWCASLSWSGRANSHVGIAGVGQRVGIVPIRAYVYDEPERRRTRAA